MVGSLHDVDSRNHELLIRIPHTNSDGSPVVDRHDSHWHRFAFRDSFAQSLPKLVWMHRKDEPIGVCTEAQITKTSNELRARLSDTDANATARRAYSDLLNRSVDQFSFGFTDAIHRPSPVPALRRKKIIEYVKARMVEASPVVSASIPGTELLSLRSAPGDDFVSPSCSELADQAVAALTGARKVMADDYPTASTLATTCKLAAQLCMSVADLKNAVDANSVERAMAAASAAEDILSNGARSATTFAHRQAAIADLEAATDAYHKGDTALASQLAAGVFVHLDLAKQLALPTSVMDRADVAACQDAAQKALAFRPEFGGKASGRVAAASGSRSIPAALQTLDRLHYARLDRLKHTKRARGYWDPIWD
jgi:prohead serine protease